VVDNTQGTGMTEQLKATFPKFHKLLKNAEPEHILPGVTARILCTTTFWILW
jgi:hypothetical protein